MALIIRPKLSKLDILPGIKGNVTNAYCKFRCQKNHLISKVHFNCGRSPDWSDELTLNSFHPDAIMWVQVFHQQPPHDILLGVGHIVMKQLELCAHQRKVCELVLMSGGMQPKKTGTITISFEYVASDVQSQNPDFEERIANYQVFVPSSYELPQISSEISSEDNSYNPQTNDMQISAVGNGIQITDSRVIYEKIQQESRSKSRSNIRQKPSNKGISPIKYTEQKTKPTNNLPLNHQLNNPKQQNTLPNVQLNNLNLNSPNQKQNIVKNINIAPQMTPQVLPQKVLPPSVPQQQPVLQTQMANIPQGLQKMPQQQFYQPPQTKLQQPQQVQNPQIQQTTQAQLQAQQAYVAQNQLYQQQLIQQQQQQQYYPQQQMYTQEVYYDYGTTEISAYDYGVQGRIEQDYIEVVAPQLINQVQHASQFSPQSIYGSVVAPMSTQAYKLQLQQGMQAVLKQQQQSKLQNKMAEQLMRQWGMK